MTRERVEVTVRGRPAPDRDSGGPVYVGIREHPLACHGRRVCRECGEPEHRGQSCAEAAHDALCKLWGVE